MALSLVLSLFLLSGRLFGAGDTDLPESELESESLSLELELDEELLLLLLLELDELELLSLDELELELASTVIFILDGAISSSESLSVSDGERDFLPKRVLASRPLLDLILTGCLRIGDLRLFIGDRERDLCLCLWNLPLLRTGLLRIGDLDRLYLGREFNLSSQLAGECDLDRLKFCLGLNGDLERLSTPNGDREGLL